MPLEKLQIPAGVVRDRTKYSAAAWWDTQWVRFRSGLPEKMGGWVALSTTEFLGTCRFLVDWTSLIGTQLTAVGTNLKMYVEQGGGYTDITPLRRTVTLGTNPFAFVSSSTTVTVTDVAHGGTAGDFVTYTGTTGTVGGFNTTVMNDEFQIATVPSANTYTVTLASAATGTGSGGGVAVLAKYQIQVGLDTTVIGTGWGAGAWSRGEWGSAANITASGAQLRLWTADPYGEDLFFCPRGGGLYLFDYSVGDRGTALADLVDAVDAPVRAQEVLVSDIDRHAIAFGCTPIGGGDPDPLLIRFSDSEDIADWSPSTTNEAGFLRLGIGSQFQTAVQTKQEILIWTDVSLHSMQYIGAPFVFALQTLGNNVTIASPNAKVMINDVVFWMGAGQVYRYDGRLTQLDCPVQDYVFRRMNMDQILKVCCGTIAENNEVIWFYPSTGSSECDSYLLYDFLENVWAIGSLERTYWIDRSMGLAPLASSTDPVLYIHETGFDDGSENPPAAIPAWATSGPVEIGNGERFGFVRSLVPDITFLNSTRANPSMTITLYPQNYPGEAVLNMDTDALTVTQGQAVPVETFTRQAFVRVRGRSMIVDLRSTEAGMTWRSGQNRIDIRTDGKK